MSSGMSSGWGSGQAPGDGQHDRTHSLDGLEWLRELDDWNAWRHNDEPLHSFDSHHNLNPLFMFPVPAIHSPPQHMVEGPRPLLHRPPRTTAFARPRLTPVSAPTPAPFFSHPASSTRLPAISSARDCPPGFNPHAHPPPSTATGQTANGSQRWASSASNPATDPAPDQYRSRPFTFQDLLAEEATSDFSSESVGGDDVFDLDELLAEDDNMPSRMRNPNAMFTTFDLTGESSSSVPSSQRQPRDRRRPAIDAASPSRTVPRKRRAHEISRSDNDNIRRNSQDKPIESVDLTSEAAVADASLAQTIAHQQESAAARAGVSTTKQKLGQLQCIICMEPFTNATTTHCGHVYCHECLTQALLASAKSSENGVGHCPVCRKVVSKRRQNQVVPIAFMKRSAFRGKGRQQV